MDFNRCPPVPEWMLRPAPTQEAWDRFREHYERITRRRFVPAMPKTIPVAQPQQDQPAEGQLANTLERNMGINEPGKSVYDTVEKKWIHGPKVPAHSVQAAGSDAARVPDFKTKEADRGAIVSGDDPVAGLTLPELLSRATELGYEEQPFPNGGVRVMRIKNFLRNHAKKAKK